VCEELCDAQELARQFSVNIRQRECLPDAFFKMLMMMSVRALRTARIALAISVNGSWMLTVMRKAMARFPVLQVRQHRAGDCLQLRMHRSEFVLNERVIVH
jgi:hypothetical protein